MIRLPFQFIKLFCRQDGGIAQQPFAPHNLPKPHYPSKSTIHLAHLVKGELLSPEKIRATTGGIALHPPTIPKTHYSLPRTITLASLVKGRWIDGKAQALILLLSACDMPTIFMLQTFCRQDGGIAQQPLSPHNPFQNRTIPLPCTTFSAPLSKVSWIATRLLLS